uniref:DM2 domain-containing protein n=1 Tax=Globisporangium ultimum (strain ATCC 200006 / CBS 805.95 / DAOM BR144) TaxID=431595 RepID=K3WHR4_GLOUD
MNDSGIGLELELGIGSDTSLPMVDEAQLTDAIRTILQDADLEQLSRRMIRKQLEAQFHMDLSHYKDMINATILELIEQQTQQQEEDDADDAQEPEPSDDEEDEDADDEYDAQPRKKAKTAAKKKATPVKRKRAAPSANGEKTSNAFNMLLSLSPELASVVGSETMARPQIVKSLWEYIREHNLQDPNNKRHIIFDDKLRRVFQRDSVTMFSMNKFVKRHVRKPEDLPPNGWTDIHRDGVSSDEDADGKAAKKKASSAKRKKKSSAGDDDDEDGGKKTKRSNPFNTELAISPELAAVVGSDRMARPQIVKSLWEYIHAHNLQDPSDKRTIILDHTLRQVFQRDSVTMFSMNKYIKRHARKPEDVPAGGWAAIPRDGLSSDEDESKKPKKKSKKAIKQEQDE